MPEALASKGGEEHPVVVPGLPGPFQQPSQNRRRQVTDGLARHGSASR